MSEDTFKGLYFVLFFLGGVMLIHFISLFVFNHNPMVWPGIVTALFIIFTRDFAWEKYSKWRNRKNEI